MEKGVKQLWFNVEDGRFQVIDHKGVSTGVKGNGKLVNKFLPRISGFIDHNRRKQLSIDNPNLLPEFPECLNPVAKTGLYQPRPDKFDGYS